MLYVCYGDRYAAREYARSLVEVCKQKRSDAEYLHYPSQENECTLEHLLTRQGLFDSRCIIFCDESFSNSHAEKELMGNLPAYVSSEHMFIIFEPNLDIKLIKKLEKQGVKLFFSEKRQKGGSNQSLFTFTDTFLRGDRKKTLAICFTLLREESATSLLNILLWQVRTLVLVSRTHDAEEAGVKPFVYTKTKKALEVIKDPFSMLCSIERGIRHGRLRSQTDQEILEYLIVSV